MNRSFVRRWFRWPAPLAAAMAIHGTGAEPMTMYCTCSTCATSLVKPNGEQGKAEVIEESRWR